jgi:hypothetical protein
MIFETFQHMCIAAIGMLESERDTQIDFTNQNGVEFGISIRAHKKEFEFGLFIGCEETAYFECFLKSSTPEEITAKHIIDAAISMADFVGQNRNIDQYDLIELKNRHHDNS